MPSVDWGPTIAHLIELGFVQSGPLEFQGRLRTEFGSVSVQIALDADGIDFPNVKLLQRPTWLPANCAHLGSDLALCCVDKDTGAPDRRHPLPQVQTVLARARALLETLVLSGGHIGDEFVRTWPDVGVAIGFIGPTAGDGRDWKALSPSSASSWVCLAESSQIDKVEIWLGTAAERTDALTPIHLSVSAGALKAGGPGWPIRNIFDFSAWLTYWEEATGEALSAKLHSISLAIAESGRKNGKLFVLMHQGPHHLGIVFNLSRYLQWLPPRPRRSVQSGANQIYNSLLSESIGESSKFRFVEIAGERLIERAIGQGVRGLTDLKIAILGAGSVGSFLTGALVRSGAGLGNGSLTIFDPDLVNVENLARSAYDSRHVGLNKAEAARQFAIAVLPGLKIEAIPKSAPRSPEAFEFDLIVDATGDHSYSAWLSEKCLRGELPPIIFAWIAGQGAAAVSYLQEPISSCCFSCLAPADPDSAWNPLSNPGEGQSHQTGPCGESFMPYSVAAPLAAAGLAISLALDLSRGLTRSPFRVSRVSHSRTREITSSRPSACRCHDS